MDLRSVTAEAFAPHRETEFRVLGPVSSGPALRLREVNRRGSQPHAPRSEPFSLVFVGPADQRLEQRIYRLQHDDLGVLEIFLVPIGYDPDGGLRYEAVFN